MIQFQLETDVPESREVTVTLPPDTPTGRVRLQVEVTPETSSESPKPDPRLPRLQALLPDEYIEIQLPGILWVDGELSDPAFLVFTCDTAPDCRP